MPYLINIIGAGKLGKTLGHLLLKQKCAQIGGVLNSSKLSSEQAIHFIGSGTYYEHICDLPASEITLICTPDDLIPEIALKLSQSQLLKENSIVMHCSGCLNSDALMAVKARGCYVASIHPMRSFAEPLLSIEQYPGTYCALEGDAGAIPSITELFQSIDSFVYTLDKEKKVLYHTAGVFSSNYLITLSRQSFLCLINAGIDEDLAMKIIINLMQDTLSNLKSLSLAPESLTGPIQRADISVIDKHMSVLLDADQKSMYAALGKATLALTKHDQEKRALILKALGC